MDNALENAREQEPFRGVEYIDTQLEGEGIPIIDTQLEGEGIPIIDSQLGVELPSTPVPIEPVSPESVPTEPVTEQPLVQPEPAPTAPVPPESVLPVPEPAMPQDTVSVPGEPAKEPASEPTNVETLPPLSGTFPLSEAPSARTFRVNPEPVPDTQVEQTLQRLIPVETGVTPPTRFSEPFTAPATGDQPVKLTAELNVPDITRQPASQPIPNLDQIELDSARRSVRRMLEQGIRADTKDTMRAELHQRALDSAMAARPLEFNPLSIYQLAVSALTAIPATVSDIGLRVAARNLGAAGASFDNSISRAYFLDQALNKIEAEEALKLLEAGYYIGDNGVLVSPEDFRKWATSSDEYNRFFGNLEADEYIPRTAKARVSLERLIALGQPGLYSEEDSGNPFIKFSNRLAFLTPNLTANYLSWTGSQTYFQYDRQVSEEVQNVQRNRFFTFKLPDWNHPEVFFNRISTGGVDFGETLQGVGWTVGNFVLEIANNPLDWIDFGLNEVRNAVRVGFADEIAGFFKPVKELNEGKLAASADYLEQLAAQGRELASRIRPEYTRFPINLDPRIADTIDDTARRLDDEARKARVNTPTPPATTAPTPPASAATPPATSPTASATPANAATVTVPATTTAQTPVNAATPPASATPPVAIALNQGVYAQSPLLSAITDAPISTLEPLESSGAVAFQTSQGSVYAVGVNSNRTGTSTVRYKTPHQFHSTADVGWKEPSAITVYVSPETAKEIGWWSSANMDSPRVLITPDGVITLTSIEQGRRGKDPFRVGDGKFELFPKVGLAPLELSSPDGSLITGNKMAFGGLHPGNPITSIDPFPVAGTPGQPIPAFQPTAQPIPKWVNSPIQTVTAPELPQSLVDDIESVVPRLEEQARLQTYIDDLLQQTSLEETPIAALERQIANAVNDILTDPPELVSARQATGEARNDLLSSEVALADVDVNALVDDILADPPELVAARQDTREALEFVRVSEKLARQAQDADSLDEVFSELVPAFGLDLQDVNPEEVATLFGALTDLKIGSLLKQASQEETPIATLERQISDAIDEILADDPELVQLRQQREAYLDDLERAARREIEAEKAFTAPFGAELVDEELVKLQQTVPWLPGFVPKGLLTEAEENLASTLSAAIAQVPAPLQPLFDAINTLDSPTLHESVLALDEVKSQLDANLTAIQDFADSMAWVTLEATVRDAATLGEDAVVDAVVRLVNSLSTEPETLLDEVLSGIAKEYSTIDLPEGQRIPFIQSIIDRMVAAGANTIETIEGVKESIYNLSAVVNTYERRMLELLEKAKQAALLDPTPQGFARLVAMENQLGTFAELTQSSVEEYFRKSYRYFNPMNPDAPVLPPSFITPSGRIDPTEWIRQQLGTEGLIPVKPKKVVTPPETPGIAEFNLSQHRDLFAKIKKTTAKSGSTFLPVTSSTPGSAQEARETIAEAISIRLRQAEDYFNSPFGGRTRATRMLKDAAGYLGVKRYSTLNYHQLTELLTGLRDRLNPVSNIVDITDVNVTSSLRGQAEAVVAHARSNQIVPTQQAMLQNIASELTGSQMSVEQAALEVYSRAALWLNTTAADTTVAKIDEALRAFGLKVPTKFTKQNKLEALQAALQQFTTPDSTTLYIPSKVGMNLDEVLQAQGELVAYSDYELAKLAAEGHMTLRGARYPTEVGVIAIDNSSGTARQVTPNKFAVEPTAQALVFKNTPSELTAAQARYAAYRVAISSFSDVTKTAKNFAAQVALDATPEIEEVAIKAYTQAYNEAKATIDDMLSAYTANERALADADARLRKALTTPDRGNGAPLAQVQLLMERWKTAVDAGRLEDADAIRRQIADIQAESGFNSTSTNVFKDC